MTVTRQLHVSRMSIATVTCRLHVGYMSVTGRNLMLQVVVGHRSLVGCLEAVGTVEAVGRGVYEAVGVNTERTTLSLERVLCHRPTSHGFLT